MAALTFPELKTFFKGSTAAPAARALLEYFATPQELATASTEHVAEVLRSAHAYSHATRAAELQALARATAGVPTLTHHQWRQAWLIKQLSVVERARRELVDEVALATATHPYTQVIESLLSISFERRPRFSSEKRPRQVATNIVVGGRSAGQEAGSSVSGDLESRLLE